MKNKVYRKDEIVKLCKDKSVLHLGFIQHDLYEQKILGNDWLHSKIANVAATLVGFDYLADNVEKIRQKYGYECYFANVMELENVELKQKFDVIVCGELIEHIENPGLMLDGIKRFMHSDSIVIITSPNPWSKHRIKLIQSGILENKWLNKEHVCWYSFETLKQLLERKGFQEVNYTYYYSENKDIENNADFSIFNQLRKIKRYLVNYNMPIYLYDGLFFTAKIGE